MLPLFDPTLQPSHMPNEKDATLIPVFKQPKIYSGLLPGNAIAVLYTQTVLSICWFLSIK